MAAKTKQMRKQEIMDRLSRVGQAPSWGAGSKAARKKAVMDRLARLESIREAGTKPGSLEHRESFVCRDVPKRLRKEKILRRLNSIVDDDTQSWYGAPTPESGAAMAPHPPTMPRPPPGPNAKPRPGGPAAPRPMGGVAPSQEGGTEQDRRRRARQERKKAIMARLQHLVPESEPARRVSDVDPEAAAMKKVQQKQLIIERLKKDLQSDTANLDQLTNKKWSDVKDVIPERQKKEQRKKELINKLQSDLQAEEAEIQRKSDDLQRKQENEMCVLNPQMTGFVKQVETLPKWKRKQMILARLKEDYQESDMQIRDLQRQDSTEVNKGMLPDMQTKQQRKRLLINKIQRDLEVYEASVQDFARKNSLMEAARVRRRKQQELEDTEEDDLRHIGDQGINQYMAELDQQQLPKWRRKELIYEKLKRTMENDEHTIVAMQQKTWAEVNEVMPTLTEKKAKKMAVLQHLQEKLNHRETELERRAAKQQQHLLDMGLQLTTFAQNLPAELTSAKKHALLVDQLKAVLEDKVFQEDADEDMMEDDDDDDDDDVWEGDAWKRKRAPVPPDERPAELPSTPSNPRRVPVPADEGAAAMSEYERPNARRRPVHQDEGAVPLREDQLRSGHEPHYPPYARRRPAEHDEGAVALNERDYHSPRRDPVMPDEGAASLREPRPPPPNARRGPSQVPTGVLPLAEADPYARRYPTTHMAQPDALDEKPDPYARRYPAVPSGSVDPLEELERYTNPYARRYPIAPDERPADPPSEPRSSFRRPRQKAGEAAPLPEEARTGYRNPVMKDEPAAEPYISKEERKKLFLAMQATKQNLKHLIEEEIKRHAAAPPDANLSPDFQEFLIQQRATEETLKKKKEQRAKAKREKWLGHPAWNDWLAFCDQFMLDYVRPDDDMLGLEAFTRMYANGGAPSAAGAVEDAVVQFDAPSSPDAPPDQSGRPRGWGGDGPTAFEAMPGAVAAEDTPTQGKGEEQVQEEIDRLAAEVDMLEKEEELDFGWLRSMQASDEGVDDEAEEELLKIEAEVAELEEEHRSTKGDWAAELNDWGSELKKPKKKYSLFGDNIVPQSKRDDSARGRRERYVDDHLFTTPPPSNSPPSPAGFLPAINTSTRNRVVAHNLDLPLWLR